MTSPKATEKCAAMSEKILARESRRDSERRTEMKTAQLKQRKKEATNG